MYCLDIGYNIEQHVYTNLFYILTPYFRILCINCCAIFVYAFSVSET